MKRRPSISHNEATVRELRDNPEFAVAYLRAALEDDDEPSVLLIALRRIAEARAASPKWLKPLALSERACTAHCRLEEILGSPPLPLSPGRWV